MDIERRHYAYLARYNASVNQELIGFLAALPAGELSRPKGSYFGSIQGILDHVIMCDINWLRRLREHFAAGARHEAPEPLSRPRLAPAGYAWTTYAFPDFEEFRRERGIVDAIFVDWIALADTSRFGEVLAYLDSHGSHKRFYLRDALDHVFNHQTHHRGQVSQILDELKVEHDWSNLIRAAEMPE